MHLNSSNFGFLLFMIPIGSVKINISIELYSIHNLIIRMIDYSK